MLEVIEEALIDSFKLLPFLFITYLVMEYIEHKTSKKSKEVIKKIRKIWTSYWKHIRNISSVWFFSFSN